MKIKNTENVVEYGFISPGETFRFTLRDISENKSTEGLWMKVRFRTTEDCELCVNIQTGEPLIDVRKSTPIIPKEVIAEEQ